MKIYLVRHAEKESEGENPNLTKKGIKQSKYLAKRLKKKRFEKFYCSDMNRAKQTAEIVSKQIRLKPKIEKSLNEYESSDIKRPLSKWDKEDSKRYKKLILFLNQITKNPEDEKNLLIICHGITNRIILASLLNMPMKRIIVFFQHETCIDKLDWSEKFTNWRLKGMNDYSHLPRTLR